MHLRRRQPGQAEGGLADFMSDGESGLPGPDGEADQAQSAVAVTGGVGGPGPLPLAGPG